MEDLCYLGFELCLCKNIVIGLILLGSRDIVYKELWDLMSKQNGLVTVMDGIIDVCMSRRTLQIALRELCIAMHFSRTNSKLAR